MNPTFTHRGMRLTVNVGRYAEGGGLAVWVTESSGMPYCKLSVNVLDDFGEPEITEPEFLVPVWNLEDDTALVKAVFGTGLFERTGRFVPVGYAEAAVWRYIGPLPLPVSS